ncbi:MAG: FAD-dependent oxidoreductase [Alphaproteobacteria bacterium]
MKNHAQVVVIGGGVVGCSVLYHLTKLGWNDVMLVERSELTSGSTWHAAGGFHTLNADTNMAALQGYTIKLYKELEEITGQSCGLHHVGGITLATDNDRMDLLKAERAKHRYMGLETEIIGPDDVKKLSSLINISGVIGALYDPLDGHLDPSGTTHAYAKAAKMGGASIVLRNPVLETNPNPDGSWQVVTQNGTIHAEHVVNAGGLWARELASLAGVYLPLHPMEHQYMITEALPEIMALDSEHPHIVDPSGESYTRQEGQGLCIGFYEQNCTLWAEKGTPLDFGHELLEPDLERVGGALELAWNRFPVLERAGIKKIINGPFTFAPDGNPLVGPVPGLRNYWSASAVMAGFSQAGGVGLTLAEWMVEGEPSRDVMALDVARFGNWVTPGYTRDKVQEFYQRRFSVTYPNEELPASRPFKTSPMYTMWQQTRAVFGAQYGLEVANHFAPQGQPLHEEPSFRRSNIFESVGGEVKTVRTKVGINELTNFGKYRFTGVNAAKFLNIVMAGRLPKQGRLTLSPMLSPKGRLIGDFTITCLNDGTRGTPCYQLTASYGMQSYHMRWFETQLTRLEFDGVQIENMSNRLTGFQIAGPKSRAVLAELLDDDISNEAFKFLDARYFDLGNIQALIQRVSFTGDLGYEIYVKTHDLLTLYHKLRGAGNRHEMKPFGMRAMMSLRLDRFFGSWMREYRPDYTCAETGLDRFINWKKEDDFIGRAAVYHERENPPARRLCHFEVMAKDADVVGYEPIFIDGEVVGFCTSGGYSHHAQKSIAFGFVPTHLIKDDLEVQIELLGEMLDAKILTAPLFEPNQ